jgi:uncharacterized protein with HEPN domain
MRDDRQRLLDVQEAIEQIEKYTDQGRDAFDQNELIQTWVIHYLQIIGEACRAISALQGSVPGNIMEQYYRHAQYFGAFPVGSNEPP